MRSTAICLRTFSWYRTMANGARFKDCRERTMLFRSISSCLRTAVGQGGRGGKTKDKEEGRGSKGQERGFTY